MEANGGHWIKAPVEPEDELVEVGRQVLLADAMVGPQQPRFQIRKCDVDHRQVGIDFRAITTLHHRLVRLPQFSQIIVAALSVGAHHGSFYDVLLHESGERLGAAIWNETQAQPSSVDRPLRPFALGLERTGAHFDRARNCRVIVNASSFAFGASTYQWFIHFNRPICPYAVSVGPNHTSAKLMQHLEYRLVTS